ncbi:murein hydrolase activator EnvC family protein [Roseburia sp. AM23-20]|jgi:murein DD-endopeptidase MepM/ murein hydrolase activator NlpD|uniref:murein hydrolase activator EnvC family protein n=1 Tax=Roseburia sp. AM23-20 TaxID=2292066 RepID=UPI001FAAD1C6|nr:M23 family metallopeptidase [Roseburia sp. AM23-20]
MIINKSQWIHRITAVLLIVMIGVAATVQITPAAENSSAKKSENTSTSLKEAQQEKAALEKALEDAKQTINELKESKGDVQEKVNDLNTQLMNISSQITALENRLAQKNQELTEKKDQIEDTKSQLEDAKKQEEQQYADMKVRIQFMYENAQESYFEALFSSESFSDFLNSAEYIIQIQEYDRKKLNEYQDTVDYIENVEKQLEEDYATLEEIKKEVEQEKASVEQEKASVAALMKQRETELAGIEGNIDSAQSDADYYAAEIKAQEEIIAEIKRIEAEKAAAGKQDNPYTGGVFTWPCPSSTRVTSDYGTRVSPMGGASSNHKGIDIGASGGAAIVAAADGTVTTAAYSSAAGNYVMIDHGGGLYTVYMHASALLVSPGQTVSAGQTIAQVGSTGISTGNHLHFGVSLNGSYVSPWSYLGR